jgi:hypothetical protein
MAFEHVAGLTVGYMDKYKPMIYVGCRSLDCGGYQHWHDCANLQCAYDDLNDHLKMHIELVNMRKELGETL